MMKALLRKMTVVCLVLVLAGASWAGCCKSKSGDTCDKGNGECKKSSESKDKEGKCDKAGCEKSDSADKSTEKAG